MARTTDTWSWIAVCTCRTAAGRPRVPQPASLARLQRQVVAGLEQRAGGPVAKLGRTSRHKRFAQEAGEPVEIEVGREREDRGLVQHVVARGDVKAEPAVPPGRRRTSAGLPVGIVDEEVRDRVTERVARRVSIAAPGESGWVPVVAASPPAASASTAAGQNSPRITRSRSASSRGLLRCTARLSRAGSRALSCRKRRSSAACQREQAMGRRRQRRSGRSYASRRALREADAMDRPPPPQRSGTFCPRIAGRRTLCDRADGSAPSHGRRPAFFRPGCRGNEFTRERSNSRTSWPWKVRGAAS